MNKTQKYWLIGIVAVLVLGGIWYMSSNSSAPNPYQSSNAGTGRVVFAVKDAATSVMTATSIMMTVDKVEAHSAANGWVTVTTQPRQYDLLKLKASGAAQLLADANLAAGTYDQIRLNISRVDVTAGGKTTQAKLPSNTLKIVGNVVVTAGGTSTVTLDFIADKSLHMTGDGKFILAPVVKLQSESDVTADIDADGKVTIGVGGHVDSDETVGMDEKGDTEADFELKGDLNIGDDGLIKIGSGESSSTSHEVTVALNAENNSGISGKATLDEEDGKVKVTLSLNSSVLGVLNPSEPAHIHAGVCPGVGAVVYPLNPVVNGKSETTINTTLAGLKAQLPLAINVHKSASAIGTYVACGAINL